jgi:hypothetical protein
VKKRRKFARPALGPAITSADPPSIEAIERAIGMKARRWEHRCHEVSCKMLDRKLVMGVERYGHYYGPVAREHPRHGLPFQRHGWIETPTGSVVDPTRWAFEGVEPYIYHGPGDDYDAGGQRLKASQVGPYPAGPRDESADSEHLTDQQREARRKIVPLAVTGAGLDHLMELTGGQIEDFNLDQVFWLANLPLSWWGGHAPAIYREIARVGYRAFIPVDNWRIAMDAPVASHRA